MRILIWTALIAVMGLLVVPNALSQNSQLGPTLVQIDLNFLNWAACAGNTVGWEREQREWSVWLGCDYGRTMRVWMLLPSSLNSVRRKSKNPRESGRPELRSRASRKTKTSAFKASLSRRWVSPISRPSSS
jgi:hypothetical protein